jgi:hypothetical protein
MNILGNIAVGMPDSISKQAVTCLLLPCARGSGKPLISLFIERIDWVFIYPEKKKMCCFKIESSLSRVNNDVSEEMA